MSTLTGAHTRSVLKRPIIWSALALCVLVASGVLVLALNSSAATETRSAFRWATHTLEVEDQLQETLAALGKAESAQRGFILSGDSSYDAPSVQAADTARQLLSSLRLLTRDNPVQQRRLDTLDRLVEARLAMLRTGVTLMRAGHRDSVDRLIKTGRGRSLMDSIQSIVRNAVVDEKSLFDRRQLAVDSALTHRRTTEELIVGIAILALALAAMIWVWLRRAEQIVTMCAWTKAIYFEDEWMSIEAYMKRRFGVSITHGISPSELERLEAAMDTAPVLASATRGVSRSGP